MSEKVVKTCDFFKSVTSLKENRSDGIRKKISYQVYLTDLTEEKVQITEKSNEKCQAIPTCMLYFSLARHPVL